MSNENTLKGELITDGRFEWFEEKDKANVIKHGISFKEAEAAFSDPYFYEIYDAGHSDSEQTRYFGLGKVAGKFIVLQVSYTEGERTHIITARNATANERRLYYERLEELYQ